MPQSNLIKTIANDTSAKLLPTDIGGKLRIARAVYSGTDAAGAIIELANLPNGARVLPYLSALEVAAGQNSSLTVKVGTEADDDALLTAVTPGASYAVKPFNGSILLDAETKLIATTGGAALASGKELVFIIAYVTD